MPSQRSRHTIWVLLMVVLAACTPSTAAPDALSTSRPTAPPVTSSAVPSPTPDVDRRIQIRRIDAEWTDDIDRLVAGLDVSVVIGSGRTIVYTYRGRVPRIPASNEKLLTSMAALDLLGPSRRFATTAASEVALRDGVLRGDLWLIGGGDPELGTEGLADLAADLRDAGLLEVRGAVIGDTATFHRGWWAPGWVPGLSRDYVTRPTALAIDGNGAVGSPELAAATSLTTALGRLGIDVGGSPATGDAPTHVRTLASVLSVPLAEILVRQNYGSVNFDAEMLTKALGFEEEGEGASTADGTAVIDRWAADHHVQARVADGSGLSHANRITATGLVSLLLQADRAPWGDAFERSLPPGGEGTLEGRLAGVPVRAKTGTLFEVDVSALSGYVRTADGALVAFAVLVRGMSKAAAIALEDAIVRTLAAQPFR